MSKNMIIRAISAAAAGALLVGLAACGDNAASTAGSSNDTAAKPAQELSGEFSGAGASSQKSAVDAWIAGFQAKQPNARIAYDPSGSGAGVSTFLTGATVWAGSDASLSDDQVQQSKSVCATGTAFDIPVYISPIAIVYNLKADGLDSAKTHLKLDPVTIANMFNGKITKWNDPVIAKQNPDVKLPDKAIVPIWRSDKSGTTKNFVSYLQEAAGKDAWPYQLAETWPNKFGQGAKGTAGVIASVNQADGTIGYADASQAGTLGTVAVKVGDEYVPYSAEAAAKVVDASPLDTSAKGANRVVVKIDHATSAKGAYPVVLVSYDVACTAYKDAKSGNTDAKKAQFAKQWLTYVVSAEGQKIAAENAGSAPMSDKLRTLVMKSIDAIQVK